MSTTPTPSWRSRLRPMVAGSLAAAAVVSTMALADPAMAASGAVVDSGDGWVVTREPGGYQVSLTLDEPLPMVSDAPTIVVDGEALYATESADGTTLSAFVSDPDIDTVTKGWASSDVPKAAETDAAPPATSAAQRTFETGLSRAASAQAESLPTDPGALGRYAVTEAEYDFGNSVIPLKGIGGVLGELTGKLYMSSAPGPRPTVVLMHGRHGSCASWPDPKAPANPNRWPCAEGQVNVRSYLGYEGTARALASHGYNTVSIAVNAVNSNDNQLAADYGAYARGQMVIATLDMLKGISAGSPVSYLDQQTGTTLTLDKALVNATTRTDQPAVDAGLRAKDLIGKFDLTHVGIMGHSRGGEGVMSAATINQGLAHPYGIEAVLPLAPVDFGRMTLPDTPMLVVLPYCDGDVSNQQGQHMYDDSRNAFGDNVQRTALWVMGANHNFFNSVWTPGKYQWSTGDDWKTADPASSCDTTDPTRLTADQEYQVGVSYMTGYFRYVMGGEKQFAPLYDGSIKPSTPSTGFADVRVMASQPHSATSMINDFTADSTLVRTTGASTVASCVNAKGITIPQSLPLCNTTKTSFPHWAQMRFGGNVPAFPVTRYTWTALETPASGTTAAVPSALRIAVPKETRDVSGRSQFTVKTMPDEAVPTGTDFTITFVDGAGKTFSKKASAVNSLAVNRLPGGTNATLNKLVMQQLTIPTSTMTGINLKDLREVQITPAIGADGVAVGGIYLSDMAFDTPSLGTTVIAQHTTMNLSSTAVDEGNAAGTFDVAVWLNHASSVPVTGYVSSVGAATGRAGVGMKKVTFAPGETCTTVEMPLQGDTASAATATSTFVLAVTNTQDAVMGDSAFGWLTVREDDGVAGGPMSAEVGRQGDACAEALAARTPGALEADQIQPLPGEAVTLTGRGFRAGESVDFTIGATKVDTVVANARGVATYVGGLPDGTKPGAVTATATGVGTGIARSVGLTVVSQRTVPVVTPPATTTTSAKAATATKLTGVRKIKLHRKGVVKITVGGTSGGLHPTGTVTVRNGSKVVGVATLTAADRGIVKVRVKGAKRGTLTLKATYAGGGSFTGSTSGVLKVTVVR